MTDAELLADTAGLLKSLGTALGLGLLVGLQREWVRDPVAGIRTFGLIGLLGGLAGVLGLLYGGWLIAAALVACAGTLITGNIAAMRDSDPDTGLTTEIAVLVVFIIGVLEVRGQELIAVICAGTVMIILQSKKRLHGIVHRIGEADLREIARLVLIGLVILPLLPDREMGYLGVLNPFKIWLMVVLIVGISLGAYLAGKFLGGTKGSILAGILGGMISSTATTASVSRRSKAEGSAHLSLAAIVLTASAIVFVRVIAEIFVVAPAHLLAMLPPMAAMMAWTGLVAWFTHRLALKSGDVTLEEKAPSELKGAVMFGLLYVAVLYGVAIAKEHFGTSGLYAVAGISGLTDMDAITLSTSGLVAAGDVDPKTGWRVILVGGLANVLFKAGMAAVLGSKEFLRPTLLGFAAAIAGGVAILFLWP